MSFYWIGQSSVQDHLLAREIGKGGENMQRHRRCRNEDEAFDKADVVSQSMFGHSNRSLVHHHHQIKLPLPLRDDFCDKHFYSSYSIS